jgi:hypothetical protein
MKRLILLLGVVCIGASAFAQKNHQIFKFENAGTATEVRTLGTNPQFPMLKGKSSPEQEAAAIRKEGMRDDAHGRELNNLLMETGFANGAKDVKASNVTASTIPAGSTGNMGNGTMGYQYVRLGSTNKAWKVTADNGNSIYFFGKCGNSFVPGSGVASAAIAPACKDVAVNVVSQPKTLTVEDAQASLVKQNTFIYYKKTCGAGNSAPLMLNTKDVVVTHPRTYKISVTGDPTARVCDDGSAANVNTSINVENMGSYGGFKKESKGDYKLVSKKVYDRAQKKLKKAQKKEDKVADMTHVQVHL